MVRTLLVALLVAPPLAALGSPAAAEEAPVRVVCGSDDAAEIVPALRALASTPGARQEVAEALARCAAATDGASRPFLVLGYLEWTGRADLIRQVAGQTTSERARLRAAVALANLEGDFGALALAIGRAVEAGVPTPVARHALEHLWQPDGPPESEADRRARTAVRAWLRHLGLTEEASHAAWDEPPVSGRP